MAVPTAISESSLPLPLISPRHIFPPPQRIRGALIQTSKDYVTQLLSQSRVATADDPEALLRWYDLNLLLGLLQDVDGKILQQLVHLVRRDVLTRRSAPSGEVRLLLESVKASLLVA